MDQCLLNLLRTGILLSLIMVLSACEENDPPESHLIRNVSSNEALSTSSSDSLLVAGFYSSLPPSGSGITSFRNQLRDTSRISSYIDTVSNDSLRFRAELLNTYLLCSRSDEIDRTRSLLETYLDLPEHKFTTPLASMLFYSLSTYLRYEQRHVESMAVSFKALQLADGHEVLTSNAYAQIAANLLVMSSFDNAAHYFDLAESSLPNTGFDERRSLILCNWAITESLKGNDEASIQRFHQSLSSCPQRDTAHRRYVLGKISRAHNAAHTDSALFYARLALSLNRTATLTLRQESILDYADLISDIESQRAYTIYDSLHSEFNRNPEGHDFVLQVRALEGIIFTLPEERRSYQDVAPYANQIDSLILRFFSEFDDASQLHYLEYTQELIDDRIKWLLKEERNNTTIQEIIRLIEWDRQIDMELFEGRDRQGSNVYADSRIVELLTQLNEFNFMPDRGADSHWIDIANHTMDSLNLNPKINRSLQIQPVKSFAQIYEKIKDLDSTSILIMHPIGKEYLTIILDNEGEVLYKLDREVVDSVLRSVSPLIESGNLEDVDHIDLYPQDLLRHLRSEVVIMTSGELELFPFEMIKCNNGRNLYKEHSLAFCFSLLNSRIDEHQVSIETVSAFAFTNIQQLNLKMEVSELPGTYYEVELIDSILPQSKAFFGNDCTNDRVITALGSDDLVHIASHSVLNTRNRLQSLITTKNELKLDSLTFHYSNKIGNSCSVLVLSTCSTTQGQKVPNYGYSSSVRFLKKIGLDWIVASTSSTSDSSYNYFSNIYLRLAKRKNVNPFIFASNLKFRLYL